MQINLPFGAAFGEQFVSLLADLAAIERSFVFDEGATIELAAAALTDCASIVLPTLFARFRERSGHGTDLETTTAYDTFTRALGAGGLSELYRRFPSLYRLTRQREKNWVHDIACLADRLVEDASALNDAFGVSAPFVGALPAGDTGVILTTADGRKVVYKRRSQEMDHAFGTMLNCLNRHDLDVPFVVPQTIPRDSYGWCEFVGAEAVGSEAAPSRRFQAGMFAALSYAMGGSDMHESNVRAGGAHMMVLDAEKSLRPRVSIDPPEQWSVLATGWMPFDALFERCGLAAEFWTERPRRWLGIGTDGVRRNPRSHWTETARRRAVAYFSEHEDAIAADVTAGFRHMYSIIQRHGLPLELFDACFPRVILRNSMHYHRALDRSITPVHASDDTQRERCFLALTRTPVPAANHLPDIAAAIADAECEALDDHELPRFSVSARGRELLFRGRSLGTLFEESALDRAERIVSSLTASDREQQCRLIEQSIGSLARGESGRPSVTVTFDRNLADVFV